jgi:hypothetical protein
MIMKKNAKEKAPVEIKEETPQALKLKDDYKEDIKEIKELLKQIAIAIEKLRMNGGF